MKFYSTLSKKVKVITKNATPYDIDGNKGVTYRLVILEGNDVEKIKVVDERTYTEFEPGKDYLLTCEFDIRNGRGSEVKVNGFVPFQK